MMVFILLMGTVFLQYYGYFMLIRCDHPKRPGQHHKGWHPQHLLGACFFSHFFQYSSFIPEWNYWADHPFHIYVCWATWIFPFSCMYLLLLPSHLLQQAVWLLLLTPFHLSETFLSASILFSILTWGQLPCSCFVLFPCLYWSAFSSLPLTPLTFHHGHACSPGLSLVLSLPLWFHPCSSLPASFLLSFSSFSFPVHLLLFPWISHLALSLFPCPPTRSLFWTLPLPQLAPAWWHLGCLRSWDLVS